MKHYDLSRAAAAVMFFLGLTAGASTGETAATQAPPLALGSVPLLFVDDASLLAQRGVVRTIHPARTRSAPVIESEKPWEGGRVYTYGTPYFDAASGRFWLWYMSRTQRPDGTRPAPKLRGGGQDIVLLATSRDGLAWDRPALGAIEYDGSTANNIVADFHTPSVVVDAFERDPARRFKLLGYSGGGYYASYSGDGVHWHAFPKNPVFKGSDTMTMTQDPRTGEFLVYFKQPSTEVPGRVVWLRRSRDLQTFSEPKLVFYGDAEDNRWARTPEQRTEIYNMSVLPHAGGFIGLPTMFRVMARTPKEVKLPPSQSSNDGPIDVQMVTSTDGETWRHTWPRINVIPRGAPGTFDGGAILGVSSASVDAGDETWMFYTAINTGHGAPIPPKRLTIGRAAWRRNGFASLDASPAGGRIETKPLELKGAALLINADASRGELRAALVTADGKPIAGFALEDFVPLRSDASGAVAQWKSGRSLPTQAVRVVIEMTSARLFSLRCENVAR